MAQRRRARRVRAAYFPETAERDPEQENENARLRRENNALRSEVKGREVAAAALHAEIADLRNPEGVIKDDAWHLNQLLRAWGEASERAREGLMTIVKAAEREGKP